MGDKLIENNKGLQEHRDHNIEIKTQENYKQNYDRGFGQ